MRNEHTNRRSHPRHARSKPRPEARRPESAAPAPDKETPPATPQAVCSLAQQIILRHWPDIIQAQVEKALGGSHQHAKYLGEYAGFSAALAAPAGEQDASLAALLLKRLDIAPEADLAAANHAPALE